MNIEKYKMLKTKQKECIVGVLKKLEQKYGLFEPCRRNNAWNRKKAVLVKEIQKKKRTLCMMKRLKEARKSQLSPTKTITMSVQKANKIAALEAENENLRNMKEEIEKRLDELREDKSHLRNGTRVLHDKQKQIRDNINGKFKCIQCYEKVVELLALKCQKLEAQYTNYLRVVRETPNRILGYETKTTEWTHAKNKENELKLSVEERKKTLQEMNQEIDKCQTECYDRALFAGEVVFVLTDALRAQYTQQDVELNKVKRQHLMSVLLNILSKRNNLTNTVEETRDLP
uniref:Uncharacterized protein n=1 Tax=Cacopsylla melanoneura TaxID=428564 RepID=A0A8D8Z9J5_9HEMI